MLLLPSIAAWLVAVFFFALLPFFSGGNLPCVACPSGGLPQAPNGMARVWGEALPRGTLNKRARLFKVARRQGGNAMPLPYS